MQISKIGTFAPQKAPSFGNINKFDSKKAVQSSDWEGEDSFERASVPKKEFDSKKASDKMTNDEFFEDEEEKRENSYKLGSGLMMAGLISYMIFGQNPTKTSNSELNENREKTMDKFAKELNVSDTIKNGLEIKDLTDDGSADVVLTRKDGTKVVFDLQKGRVIENKK